MMNERYAWIRYPANPSDPVKYPAVIKQVKIIDFVSQQAYHNPDAPNYDVPGEVHAICIDLNSGRYSEESLYWIYDKEPTE